MKVTGLIKCHQPTIMIKIKYLWFGQQKHKFYEFGNFVGSCGGTMEIINGVNNQNILCESKNDYGNFYTFKKFERRFTNTQKIIFLAFWYLD